MPVKRVQWNSVRTQSPGGDRVSAPTLGGRPDSARYRRLLHNPGLHSAAHVQTSREVLQRQEPVFCDQQRELFSLFESHNQGPKSKEGPSQTTRVRVRIRTAAVVTLSFAFCLTGHSVKNLNCVFHCFSHQSIQNSQKLDLSFQNVCASIGGKEILKNVSGSVEPGTMMAVLGPSGIILTLF